MANCHLERETEARLPVSYGVPDPEAPEPVNATRVAIPEPGQAGTASLVDLMQSADRDLLLSHSILKSDSYPTQELARLTVICHVAAGHYRSVVRRLLESSMETLLDKHNDVIEKSIFAVPKTA